MPDCGCLGPQDVIAGDRQLYVIAGDRQLEVTQSTSPILANRAWASADRLCHLRLCKRMAMPDCGYFGHQDVIARDRLRGTGNSRSPKQVPWGQTTRGHADKIAETGHPSLGIRRSALPSAGNCHGKKASAPTRPMKNRGQTTRGHTDKIAETGHPNLGIRRSALPSAGNVPGNTNGRKRPSRKGRNG